MLYNHFSYLLYFNPIVQHTLECFFIFLIFLGTVKAQSDLIFTARHTLRIESFLFYGLEWIYNVICEGFELDFPIIHSLTQPRHLLWILPNIIELSGRLLSSCRVCLSSTALLRDILLLILLSVFLVTWSWQLIVLNMDNNEVDIYWSKYCK